MENTSEWIQDILFKNDIQIFDNDREKIYNEKKIKSVKFSNNIKEIKAQLKSKFNLYLEGHIKGVNTIAVTRDNKYIVWSSEKNSIRIWSLLKKRQETVLQGPLEELTSIAVSNNNKYIISGSSDKKIGIWNLLQKTQESVLQGHLRWVSTVGVTADNK